MLRFSSPLGLALACATLAATPSIDAAPTVWRCGNSYSHTPCEGASAVGDSLPEPTAEQRRQADEGVRRDQAAAERMQHERLKLDAQPRQAAIIGAPASDTRHAEAIEPKARKKNPRLKKPEAFVASYADPNAALPTKKKKKKPGRSDG